MLKRIFGQGVAYVKTYRDVLDEYRTHPETKTLEPDGEVCGRQTVGLLQRRPVTVLSIAHVGKESNRMEEVEAGLVHDPEEVYTTYADPEHDAWQMLVVPVLKRMPLRLIQEQTHLSRTQIKAIRNGHARPHKANRDLLLHVVGGFARTELQTTAGLVVPGNLEACAAFLGHVH